MSSHRIASLDAALNREEVNINPEEVKISEFYASNVFTIEIMKKFLSEEAYLGVMSAIEKGSKLDRTVADQVASSMKAWAMEKDATHYTHWFQPLTGRTAEKHDSFFVPNFDGSGGIEEFSGDALTQQEPDASSFPNGGLRATFEARGYTAWDPTSPAFIKESAAGKTLCIPTIFVSYTGEMLGYKAPLLKSLSAVEKAAVAVCQYFDKSINKVTPTLGWEQEYFLVDEALYNARPDLVMTGRALLGHMSSKNQQLDDHYFGSIPERVYAYMRDLETESHKLGIPVRTRHNEVAPGQYECAPMFESCNVAIDHNQLLMDVMEQVAKRHNLKVLFHEKPFAGVNGSGKHNNWSMSTNTGKNLLSPGKTPKKNLMFLTFFVNTIKAVHDHADLLRSTIASAGNDHRLGANEAPPAIISIFIGSTLTKVLNDIEKLVSDKMDELDKQEIKLNIVGNIPDLLLDNTDRNRTSPFAFTGNKFEVRAVGSSANCASPMTILNTIVADTLNQFKIDVDKIVKSGEKKDSAVLKVLRKYIKASKAIRFEGDNYTDEWAKEAKKRGLSNVKTTPKALDFLVTKSAADVLERNGVFSHQELEARHEIELENYMMKIQIEGRTLGEMIYNMVIPPSMSYQNEMLNNIFGLKDAGFKAGTYKAQKEIVDRISFHINEAKSLVDTMIEERKKANKMKDSRKKAIAYAEKVQPLFDKIRYHADKLELLVDDDRWPLPKYREMLFIR